jgi:hypothetical protein
MDWLLAAHQVAPLQFEMGGLWNPVSVRDQMVRGQEIARRAEIAKLISASRPLIVVGAGAGGVAAALTANNAGIPVVVIERGARPFDRQLRTHTRTIYPYLYDWPHDRHVDDALVVPAVLPWLEARADRAALSWIAALGRSRFIAYGSTVSPPPTGGPPVVVHGGMVNVHVATPAGAGWMPGGMLLSSVGFGVEITSIPAASGTYHGWYYWEPDTLGQHQLGEPGPPDVLIAGGGDGALQDAIRVLLEPVYEDLRMLLDTLPAIPESLRLAIANTDDTVTRSWLWASGGGDDCPLLRHAHTQLEAEVDAWWLRDQRAIAAALDPLWRDDIRSVQLVHSCDHFGRSFPLNRFLILLLERAVKERTQRELAARDRAAQRGQSRAPQAAPQFSRTAGHLLVDVDGGRGHTCSGRPCRGRHDAGLAAATCATPRGAPLPRSTSVAADVIILRGGVTPPVSPLASSPISNRRQYLPDRPR